MVNLTPQEEQLISQIYASEQMIDEVMSLLDIAEDEEILMLSVRASFEKKLSEFITLTILENMNFAQKEHFDSFSQQKFVTAEWMSHDEITMEFALSYPDLNGAVMKAIPGFLNDFVSGFNEAMKFDN